MDETAGIRNDRVASDIPKFLSEVKARIDRRLEELLPIENCPAHLCDAMRYSVLDGGKRVRPALMTAVAEALGADPDALLPAMCAVEMVHVCSLILDDLPSMDDAEMRHGRKANHLVYGEATAILASLALLNRAYALFNESCNGREPVRREVLDEAAKMIGTEGMIAGQIVDLEAGEKVVDEPTLEYIESHKTGALIVGAARIAARLAGARPPQLDALTLYARNVGVAYQIRDDVLRLTRRQEELGKLSHRDEHAVNYAHIHGLDESRRSLERHVADAVAALDAFDSKADHLRGLARYLAERVS